jgi:signal peptidase I
MTGPGEYHVAFANVDDQLLLWVDGDLVSFEGGSTYDVGKVFGDRQRILPQTSGEDPGDLAPAGIGARGAKLAVTRLSVWRDIYYIAANTNRVDTVITDFDGNVREYLPELSARPEQWQLYSQRRPVEFRMKEDQFFVMGDNSAESSDARLWSARTSKGGKPGGDYLERRLLIGKALCVYWPHSWHRVPGTPIPFPFFPNLEDMRLVR